MLRGSCLCGDVGYEISSPIEEIHHCHSNLTFRFEPAKDALFVAVASLDDDPGLRPQFHMFVRSKAAWHEIVDSLPQHPEYPAGS